MSEGTVPHQVLANGVAMPDRPAYYVKADDTWQPTSWKEYADQVMAAAQSLVALGIEAGDTVSILGFNRPEWTIFNVAAMAIGAFPVGIYTTNSPAECQYILAHSEAQVVLLENAGQWEKIDQVRANLPNLVRVVMMQGTEIDDDLVMTWAEFMSVSAKTAVQAAELRQEVQLRLDTLELDDVATLIYTSGTTGPPKGVMLTHDNLFWTPSQIMGPLGIDSDDHVLSYLPLSHIAEQSFSISGAAVVGYATYYAESIEELLANLKEVRPTVFFAVPRIWERFYAAVKAGLSEQTGLKAFLLRCSMRLAAEVNSLKVQGGKPSGMLAGRYWIASKILSRLRAEFGLDRCKVAACGAAPVSSEILEYMASIDLIVHEVYGQSESSGPTSFNVPGRTLFGSVGPAYPGVEVKIAEDGEILVKGRNVFKGYHKDAIATDDTLADGWLQSGDLGRFDDDAFLWITGRKKDIIITAGGKNVAPKNIESGIKNHPLVSEAVVIGDRRKFVSAVVTVDEEAAAQYMSDNGLSGDPATSDAVKGEIQTMVDTVNSSLASVAQVKKFVVLGRSLTIEDGELTPTLKVKRDKVAAHFAEEIDAMYAD